MRTIRRILAAVLACYWLAAFATTHVPVPDLGPLPKNSDKVVHVVMYAGLAFLLGVSMLAAGALRLRHYLAIVAITLVYAVVDELLQIPVNRRADLADGAADAVGVVIGLCALHLSRGVLTRLFRRIGDNDQRISPSEVGRRQ